MRSSIFILSSIFCTAMLTAPFISQAASPDLVTPQQFDAACLKAAAIKNNNAQRVCMCLKQTSLSLLINRGTGVNVGTDPAKAAADKPVQLMLRGDLAGSIKEMKLWLKSKQPYFKIDIDSCLLKEGYKE